MNTYSVHNGYSYRTWQEDDDRKILPMTMWEAMDAVQVQGANDFLIESGIHNPDNDLQLIAIGIHNPDTAIPECKRFDTWQAFQYYCIANPNVKVDVAGLYFNVIVDGKLHFDAKALGAKLYLDLYPGV